MYNHSSQGVQPMSTEQPTKKRGGARVGAGRKKSIPSPEQIAREFVFPALCQAFRADPGQWKDRYLSVTLSKTDIKRAYGADGLAIWCRYFKQEKIGGRTKAGEGYKTRWSLHLGSYDIAKLLVESLGHSLKDLPDPGFPPVAMQERLARLDALKAAREAKKLITKEAT
jgi:hypothetical protein